MIKLRNIFFSVCLIICIGPFHVFAQSLNFTFNITPTNMAVNHFAGNGVLFTNASGNFTNFSGALFTNGAAVNLGIDSGFVISTGNLNANTTNPLTNLSTDLGLPGDPLLTAIVAPQLTYDAQHLTFDFFSVSDSVEFEFIFSSEEYNQFVNTGLTDVFGIFINGPGYMSNYNLARIPGTNTPISINTINNGYHPSGPGTGPCVNCQLFIDNLVGAPGNNPVHISFNGLTSVIKIKFPVMPCEDYTLKIIIADVGSRFDDSALFFRKNSLKPVGPIYIYHNGVPITTGVINMCTGGSLTLTAPAGNQFYWSIGDTTQTITVTQPGMYQAIYFGQNNSCFATVSVNVVAQGSIPTPVISQSGVNLVSNINPGPGLTYQWFLDGVAIPGATNDTLPIQGDGCYTLMIYEGTCEATSNTICLTGTSVFEISSSSFSIIPHPVTNVSIISTPFKEGTTTLVNLYDLSGKLIFSKSELSGAVFSLSGTYITPGIYFIELQNNVSPEILKDKVVFMGTR